MAQSILRRRWLWLLLCIVCSVTPPLAMIALSGSTHQGPPDLRALNQDLVSEIRAAVRDKTFQCTPVVGGAFAAIPFQDICPDGVLIGFRLGYGKFINDKTIDFVQPIYMTASGEEFGHEYGIEPSEPLEIKAPEGYAVASALISGGGGLDALTLTFMSISGDQLDMNNARVTEKFGGRGGTTTPLGGEGKPIIGISGKMSEHGDSLGLGLVFLSATPVPKS